MTRCCSRARTRVCRSDEMPSSSRSRRADVFNQNFRQILAWSLLSAPLWVAGGIVDAEASRWVLWLGALGLDLAAPLLTYWLPGAGRYAHEPVADRGSPFRRALPALRDHRARGERRAGGRHRLGYGVERRRRRRAPARLPLIDGAVVAVLRPGSRHGPGADPHGDGRRTGPDRPRHLHLPAPPDHRRDRPCRGRRRACDRASDGRPERRWCARRARRPRGSSWAV